MDTNDVLSLRYMFRRISWEGFIKTCKATRKQNNVRRECPGYTEWKNKWQEVTLIAQEVVDE
jgi:hypothetical protein